MSQHHPTSPKHAPEHDLLIDELRDIQSELLDAVQRAEYLLRQSGFDGARLRAEAYWIPHIVCALSRDHGYLGGSMVTMEDTSRRSPRPWVRRTERTARPTRSPKPSAKRLMQK